MKRRWVGCACLLVLLSATPAGASTRRLAVQGNLWWSGTVWGPGYLRIEQTSARPVRTEGCFEFVREGAKTWHFAAYSPSILPHKPRPGEIKTVWYDSVRRDVLLFCASEAPGRVTLEVSGGVSGAHWGQAGIALLREWDLSPTSVRGTFRPLTFRRGANAWVMVDEGLLSIRSARGTDYGFWEMLLDEAPAGRYSLGLEAGAGIVLLAAADVDW
ncbi:MAG: hypothetical protein HY775_07430 [Acidobacteria bacterium]|nr:hypothetical protein [Acidobacteriota bacterium]